MSAHSEIISAAVLVIGDEILSGRTKDKNIGYIADYLTAMRLGNLHAPVGALIVLVPAAASRLNIAVRC